MVKGIKKMLLTGLEKQQNADRTTTFIFPYGMKNES